MCIECQAGRMGQACPQYLVAQISATRNLSNYSGSFLENIAQAAVGTSNRLGQLSSLQNASQSFFRRYGKPFKPTIISIAQISPWRMNGKPIRKNSIKAGIITEVR